MSSKHHVGLQMQMEGSPRDPRVEHQGTTGAAMETEQTQQGGPLHAALLADHAALEEALQRFCVALSVGSEDEAHALWRNFELDVGSHLRAEEKLILPVFERAYPHHGALLRRHHDELRRALESISVDLSRGLLEVEQVAKLLEVLGHHARHEEVVFYYWARLHLDEKMARRVVEQLRAGTKRRDGKYWHGR